MGSSATEDIIKRLMEALAVDTRVALAAALDVGPSAINGALERGEVPKAWLYQIAYETGYELEWLQTGKMEPDEKGRPLPEIVQLLKEPRIKAIVKEMGGLSLKGKDAALQCVKAIRSVEETFKRSKT